MKKPPTSTPGFDGPIARWIAAVAAVVAVLLSAATGRAAELCDPGIARVVSLQGRVEVQRAGSAAWSAAALHEPLCIGDTIRIGALAKAALALANDSVLRIDQLTTLRLGAPAATGRSLIDLLFGDIHFFSHRPRSLEIDTPIASAGTEGTEFLMRASADRTEVVMFEGRVRLQTPEGELLLASGDAGVAVAGAAPRPEIVARPRDAVAWALYYPPILAPLAERLAPPSGLPQDLQRAVERVAADDYPGAIEALDAVPEGARDARYFTYRAGVLLNVGRAAEAAAAIERALALDPEAADALAERAVIEVVQNRREQALADARRAVGLSPDSAPARIALSYALQASFDLEAARATLREAAARTPEDALVQARLAELELSFGDLGAAEATAGRAVALAPDLARTQMVLGFAALTRIDIDQAKAAFERAIDLDSAEPLARLGLGLAKIRAGDLEGGRRDLEIAAALDPNDSLLRSYLGKAYFEERRDPLDGQQYQIAKQLDPNDPTPWFYDAIRLQTINRPVEALHNIEKSIELNDNRAVYRSRLLLDEDLAVRQTSLARIYNNLGFEQLGLNEATKSLSLDPANYSAHRFLSDTYAGDPRLEIARVSELLQSQLLQPININPVQPSLPLADFNIVAGAGPAQAGFNEFTPLFARQNAQLTTTGIAGNNNTYGGESVLTMLYGHTSLSVGGSGFTTDGFRANDDDQTNLADAYAQVAVTPNLNLQAEYRYRQTDRGDRTLNFDPDSFSPSEHRSLDENILRVGSRLTLSPSSNIIVSSIYSDRQPGVRFSDTLPAFDGIPESTLEVSDQSDVHSYEVEAQYLFNSEDTSVVMGAGGYNADQTDTSTQNQTPCFFVNCFNEDKVKGNTDALNGYVYWIQRWPAHLTSTLGIGYETFDQNELKVNKATPKIGLEWQPWQRLRIRAAAVSTVKRALTANQTIEPTQVAGFNQLFDDFNGTKVNRQSVGVDVTLTDAVFVGVEASHANISPPLLIDGEVETRDQTEEDVAGYLNWVPTDRIAVTGRVRYEHFHQSEEDAGGNPTTVETVLVPVAVRYFHPSGWFGALGATYIDQSVERASDASTGHTHGTVFDATVGYRLPSRRGILSLTIGNMFDESFKFQDQSFRTADRVGDQRLVPERTVLAQVTLSF